MFRSLCFICCGSALTCAPAQTPVAKPASVVAGLSIIPAVTINANVQRTVGTKQQSGTLVLTLIPDGSFTELWNLAGQQHTFNAGPPEVDRVCTTTDASGTVTPVKTASCFQSVPWFAPWTATLLQTAGLLLVSATNALTAPASSATTTAILTSPATTSTQLTFQLAIPIELQSNQALLKQAQAISNVSTTIITSDGTTGLPSQARYSEPSLGSQPIQDTLTYSDYSAEGTTVMPHHITRALQGTVVYDIHVTSVTLN